MSSTVVVDRRLAAPVFCFRLVASASRRPDFEGELAIGAAAAVAAGTGFTLRFLPAKAAADTAADAMFLL